MGKTQTTIVWSGHKDRAEALLAAISPDDPGDFEVRISGKGDEVEFRIVVDSTSLKQSRSTVDDILACLSAADSGLDAIG
jgi:hypothetical protein